MSEEHEVLVELARHDEAWVEARRGLEQIPGKLAQLQRRLEDLKKGAAAAHAALEASRLERRAKEGQAQDLEGEIRRLNTQLFQIKTNEAYAAMLREIDAAKGRKSALETDVLVLMEREEQQAAEVKAREAALAADTLTLDAERRRVEQERAALEERVRAADAARQGLVAKLEAQVRNRYERVFASKGGRAVGLVAHGACGGCGAALPPQMLAEVRSRGAIKVCEACGRLLAWAGP